jgi:hypothetical protein
MVTDLVLAQKGKMEKNSERGSVSCEDDHFADTTVQGLGSLVGTLLQLTIVTCLLDDILRKVLVSTLTRRSNLGVTGTEKVAHQDFLRQGRVSDGPGGRSILFLSHFVGSFKGRTVCLENC